MQPSPHKAVSSGEKYAVVIGINTYRDANIAPLRYAGNDAVAIRDFLIHPELGNFKKENVHLLLDSEATLGDIRSQFVYWLGTRVQDQDEVWVYFSGRATTDRTPAVAGQPFTNYLIAQDTMRDDLAGSAIALQQLAEWLDLLGEARTILLFDCGFSGVNRGRSLASSKAPALDDLAFLPAFAQTRNRFMLLGTGATEVSLEDTDIELGLFSRILLQRLRTVALVQANTQVTWNEFYQAVAAEVAWHAEARGATQKPVKFGALGADPIFADRPVLAASGQISVAPQPEPQLHSSSPWTAPKKREPEPVPQPLAAIDPAPETEVVAETAPEVYQQHPNEPPADAPAEISPPVAEPEINVVANEHIDELLRQAKEEARTGNLYRAQDILEKAIALDPSERRAANGLRKIEEALRQIDRSELIKVAYSSALRYTDEKNYAEAVRYYAKVLEMDPTSESARLGIDSCRQLLEKQTAARSANGRITQSRTSQEKLLHAHHLGSFNDMIWPYIGWVALLGCIWQLFSTQAEGDSTAWVFWKTVASGLVGGVIGLVLGGLVYLFKRLSTHFEARQVKKEAFDG